MRREGYIIEEIIEYSNMSEAFDSVLRGTDRKRSRQGRFLLAHREKIITELTASIADGSFRLGGYHEREIEEYGKKRILQLKYHYSSGPWNWLFQLELYYPNKTDLVRQIAYMKINKFMTLPMGYGFGKKVFEHLLDCSKLLPELDMIRLRSVRRAIRFWERMKFVNTKKVDGIVNEMCMKIPPTLTGYEYVYTIRPCDCERCKQEKKQS